MLADRHLTSLMHSAQVRSRAGNWIASLNIYRRIIAQRPDFQPAYCELARLYLDRDDFERARELVSEVLKIDPENTEAHFLLGVMEYIEGNFESALRSYRIVEKVDGLDCNLAMNIALVCEALGLHEDAITHLEHAMTHGEANAKVYEVLADLYRAVEDFQQAVRVLERAVKKFPMEASLHFGLGLAQVRTGRYLLAEASFQAASRFSPEELGPLEELARLYGRLKRTGDAVSVLSRLTRLDPQNPQNWLQLARAHYALGDCKKSLHVLKEAKQVFPDNASISKEFGYVDAKVRQDRGEEEAPGGEKRGQKK